MAGLLYAYLLSIPARIAVALVPAFAIEACFYAVSGIEAARKRLEFRFSRPAAALAMTLSAALPYCVYSLPTGVFQLASLGWITVLAAATSFWYVVLPRRPAIDLAFVAFLAAVTLAGPFPQLYGTPVPKLPLAILGQLMWARLGILECLSIARMRVDGFGFLPSRKEWAAGAVNFALYIPAGIALAWLLGFAHFHPRAGGVLQTALLLAGTFLGMLWVVAFRDEFFFRGLLQRWLGRWMKSEWVGLLAAAVLFGAMHLPFRGFPNWRFAILATVAGVFFGRACLTARSVRAAMVTHALVNAVWRVLF
jgi:membrane protease YdiL (CAAX protease family)